MAAAIFNDLKIASSELLEMLASSSTQQLNSTFKNSWSAAQVGDHLIKSNSGVLVILYGKTAKANRPNDQYADGIDNLFLDFSLKFKSAESLIPSDLPIEKEVLLNTMKIKLEALQEAARTLDLSEVCLDREFPGIGVLTRLEWLHVVLSHTKRHIHQLKNIFKKITNDSEVLKEKMF